MAKPVRLTKDGNEKIEKKTCIVFCMPTTICPVQCPGCYAKRPERQYKNCLPSRMRNYEASLNETFVPNMISELKKNKRTIVRIHESGDFYSQDYLDKWQAIISACPEKRFYTYTKTERLFNFTAILSLENFNLVSSLGEFGVNFGNLEYCQKLQADGYFFCPCGIDKSIKCMRDCFACMHERKVVFLEH